MITCGYCGKDILTLEEAGNKMVTYSTEEVVKYTITKVPLCPDCYAKEELVIKEWQKFITENKTDLMVILTNLLTEYRKTT